MFTDQSIRMMKYIYAPGCALMSYKPHLADRLKEYVTAIYGPMDTLLPCCFNRPALSPETCVVTPCATCAEQYAKMDPGITSHFFLKDISESETFPFPDYRGISMSIQDTCSARTQPEVLATIRRLLERMGIRLLEPEKTGVRSKCCGQVFYGKVPTPKVEELMKKRAEEMPCQDVVVYCASCIMSMTVGGRRPRYILDLLFGESTAMQTWGADAWNCRLRDFRNSH